MVVLAANRWREEARWVCKVLPSSYIGNAKSAVDYASTHDVIRRLRLFFIFEWNVAPHKSRNHVIEGFGDEATIDGSAKLKLTRRVQCSDVSIDFLKGWLTVGDEYHNTSCLPVKFDHAADFSFGLVCHY